MSALPDPAELAPAEGPAPVGGPRLLSKPFWAMMGVAVTCLLGAGIFALIVPHLIAARRAAAPTGPAAPAAAPASLAAMFAPAAASAPPVPAVAVAPLADAPGLETRVRRLETGEVRALDAAAEALAAAGLSDAAAQPRPFADQLAAYERILPAQAGAPALRALALQGAPTRAELAAELADLAGRISVEARAPAKNAGFLAQLGYAVSRVVSIRRVDAAGTGTDAVLARALRLADSGDTAGAVGALDSGLPGSARGVLAPWREQALRRVAIDAAVATLRAQAAADLATARAGAS